MILAFLKRSKTMLTSTEKYDRNETHVFNRAHPKSVFFDKFEVIWALDKVILKTCPC